MKMTTADKAFGVIAVHKKLIARPELKDAEAELATIHGRGVSLSLEQFFRDRDRFSEKDFKRIVTTRARHGRSCSDCGGLTFLLPGQRSTGLCCEHCGGQLIQGRIDRPTERRAKEDKRREATKKYKSLLQRCEDGKDPRLFLQAADQAVDLKNYDEALVLLDKAIELYPDHPVALRKKAEIKLNRSEKKNPGRGRPTKARPRPAPTGRPRAPRPTRPLPPQEHDELADNFEDESPPGNFREQMTEQIQRPRTDSAERTFAFTPEELDQGGQAGSRSDEEEDFSNKSMEWTDEDLRQGHNAGSSNSAHKAFDPDETSAQSASYAPGPNEEKDQGDYGDYDDYGDYGDYDDYDQPEEGPQAQEPTFNTDRDEVQQQPILSAGFQSEINKEPPRNIIDKFGFEPAQPERAPAIFAEDRPVERGLPNKNPNSRPVPKVSSRANEFQQMMAEQAEHSYAAQDLAPAIPQSGGGVFELVEDDLPPANAQLEKADRRKSTKKNPIVGQAFGAPIPEAYPEPSPVPKATKETDPPWANEFAEPDIPKFSLNLGEALTFPFSPLGLVGIIFGGILLGGLSMIGGMAYFFMGLLPYFYVFAYYSRIINSAAKNHKDLPDWPDISETGKGVRIMAVNVICKLATGLVFLLIFYFQGANTLKAGEEAATTAIQNELNGENVGELTFQDSSGNDVSLAQFKGTKTILAITVPNRRNYGPSLSEKRIYLLLEKVAGQRPELRYACAMNDPDLEFDTSDVDPSINLIHTKGKSYPGILAFADKRGESYVFIDENGEIKKMMPYIDLYDVESGKADELAFLKLCTDFKEGKMTSGGSSIFSMLNSGLQIILFIVAMLFTLVFVIIYYPVAAMMAALLGTWTIVFNVPAVLRTMFLMKRDYFLKFVPFWFFIVVISWLAEPFIRFTFENALQAAFGRGALFFIVMFFFTTFLSWAVYIYGLMATGNVLGRLYYHNQKEIDWF